jgi:hypothetical protein
MDKQARERLELSYLCALRRFTSEMLRGSPRNPRFIIKARPDVEVKQPNVASMMSPLPELKVAVGAFRFSPATRWADDVGPDHVSVVVPAKSLP